MRKNYPAKSKRLKTSKRLNKFDKSHLTDADFALLNAFEKRRERFDRFLEASNIIYHKKTCPGCGFPTFETDEASAYSTCPICLWEGYTSDKNDVYEGPPNYISLIAHRINVSSQLQLFLQTHELDPSMDKLIRSIRHFEKSGMKIDRNSFDRNLKNILPTKPKTN